MEANKILENRFKILFLFFLYTENEIMLDEMQRIADTYTKVDVNKIAAKTLRQTLFEHENCQSFLSQTLRNETELRWNMLFMLSCENGNDTFTDMLESLQVKINEKHPNAKKMLTYVEQMAVDMFEVKETAAKFSLN